MPLSPIAATASQIVSTDERRLYLCIVDPIAPRRGLLRFPFVHRFNHERPHQALDINTRASLSTLSTAARAIPRSQAGAHIETSDSDQAALRCEFSTSAFPDEGYNPGRERRSLNTITSPSRSSNSGRMNRTF